MLVGRRSQNAKLMAKVKHSNASYPLNHSIDRLGRVSSKGQVVIPAELREKLKIARTVLIREGGGKIVIEPWVSMEEAFGSGGREMIDAAIEISGDRRREVESETPVVMPPTPVSSSSSMPVSPAVKAFFDGVFVGRGHA